jgi:hypothetical protein
MSGREQSLGTQQEYERFLETQSRIILSTSVYQQVVEDLASKDLKVLDSGLGRTGRNRYDGNGDSLSSRVSPMEVMRRFANDGTIEAKPIAGTEMIEVSMTSPIPDEAIMIVDQLAQNYRNTYDVGANLEGQRNLEAVIQENNQIVKRITETKARIRAMAQQSGVAIPETGSAQEMLNAERLSTILKKSIELESKRITLETELAVSKQTMDPNAMAVGNRLGERESFVNADAHVIELTRQVVALEQELLVTQKKQAPTDPRIKETAILLAAFEQQLSQRVEARGQEYELLKAEQAASMKRNKLEALQTELSQVKQEEQKYKELFSTEELKSIRQGNTLLAIRDFQKDIDQDMEISDQLSRRIKQMEMQRNQKPRVTIEEPANIRSYDDPRLKYMCITLLSNVGILIVLSMIRGRLSRHTHAAECQ